MDSVVLAAVQLRPLRGPLDMDAGPTIHPAILILMLFLAVATAYLLMRRSRSWRLTGPAAIAERELVRLLGLRLAEQGRLKEHYALLAACLRRYVADAYGLPARALTPAELAAALAPESIDPRSVDSLQRLLGTGDLVRFDHTGKTPEEARADVLGALDVIRAASAPPAASAA
jgi:hypothetical protein